MLVEKSIQIIGSKKLNGTIEVSGAKNAVLKQMILPILSEGKYKIEKVPDIADVYYMQEVLNVLGITSELTNKSLICLLYTSPSPRDGLLSRMPSSA